MVLGGQAEVHGWDSLSVQGAGLDQSRALQIIERTDQFGLGRGQTKSGKDAGARILRWGRPCAGRTSRPLQEISYSEGVRLMFAEKGEQLLASGGEGAFEGRLAILPLCYLPGRGG